MNGEEAAVGQRRVRWLVSGRVQGVSFRYFTRQNAQRLGLAGWVRNRPDGTVEAVVEGPENVLADLRREIQQGPPMARVLGIEETVAPTGELPSLFEIHF